MSILGEDWDDNDYVFRNMMSFALLPKNNAKKMDGLGFPFEDYKANQKLACHVYEKMSNACINQHGIRGSYYSLPCQEAFNNFDMCVKNHQAMAMVKKYYSDMLVTNPLSSGIPSRSDV